MRLIWRTRRTIRIRYSIPPTRSGLSRCANSLQDCLSFFTLPPEVRNKIYREYFDLISWTRFGDGRSIFQPALTIVSKQVRVEALPIFYGENLFFLAVHSDSSKQWTGSVHKTISAFVGDSDNSPGSSSLRYLKNLNLMLHAGRQVIPPVEIKIEMTSDVLSQGTGYAGHDEYDPDEDADDELLFRRDRLRSRVRVGSTNLDWTDHEAVRAACDKAARTLGAILAERELLLDFEMSSTTPDYQFALDVVCMFASTCPHLKKTVFIRDNTEPARSMPYDADRARVYFRERY